MIPMRYLSLSALKTCAGLRIGFLEVFSPRDLGLEASPELLESVSLAMAREMGERACSAAASWRIVLISSHVTGIPASSSTP